VSAGEGTASDVSPPSDRIDPRVLKICAVVLLGPLMAQMDATVVSVSLSTIGHELGASIDAAQWIIGGYLLALALMLPLNAWLVDRLGAKRLYLACFAAFTLASVLCGSASTLAGLVGARVLQGAAGGLLAPMAQMMVARIAGRHMARMIGYSAMPVLLAPIVGPSVAGAILKYADWPWLFYVNLPIGVLAVLLAAWLLPRDERMPAAQRRAFDFVGFVLLSPGLAAMLYGFDHLRDPGGVAFGLAGVALLGAFAWHAARRKSRALIDLRLFRIRVFAVAATTQCLANAATFAGQLLMPLFLVAGRGFTPTHAGLLLAPMGVGMLCVSPAMGYLTERFGCRAVAAGGALLTLASTLPILWMSSGRFSSALMGACLLARGAGQGATGVPTLSAGYAAVPRDQLPLATTAANIVQRVGGPVGTTVLAIVVATTAGGRLPSVPGAFTTPFVALIALHLLVFAAATRLPIRIPQPAAAGRP